MNPMEMEVCRWISLPKRILDILYELFFFYFSYDLLAFINFMHEFRDVTILYWNIRGANNARARRHV